MNADSQWSEHEARFVCATLVWLVVNTTPVSFLVNKLVGRSILHRQESLAVVNQICVIHEAMNGCKNLKIH